MSAAGAGAAVRARGSFCWRAALAFVLPLGMAAKVQAGGELFGAEIAALVVLPVLLLTDGRRTLGGGGGLLLALAGVWLAGQVATDLAVGAPSANMAKGAARVVMLAVLLAVFLALIRGRARMAGWAALGLGAGLALQTLADPDALQRALPVKFGYGPALLLAVGGACALCRVPRWLRAAAFAGVAALALGEGARSLALIAVLAGVAEAVRPRAAGAEWRRLVLGAVLLALAGGTFAAGYGALAGAGALGPEQQAKHARQAGSDLGLLAGRGTVLAGLEALAENPWLGRGSWARDRESQIAHLRLLAEAGVPVDLERPVAEGRVVAHSHLVGSWLEGGILAAPFWIAALWLCVRGLARVAGGRAGVLAPLAIVAALTLGWDVLFSPFGAEARIKAAFALAVLVSVREGARA
ncbi:hypothetical protein [Futiania mangrovi]|uniref:O-antigen ligase family protein n=1 Tax=Futiania mangrovi TaxID=2959716 RepID=A0A9J6PAD1_9PROT|nr:hypothetical protein [Futiania mangrovii]MCP1335361.1 hypothetical protein [Futiania mangrovii]